MIAQSTGGKIKTNSLNNIAANSSVTIENSQAPHFVGLLPNKRESYVWKYKWLINGVEHITFNATFDFKIDSTLFTTKEITISRFAKYLMIFSEKDSVYFEVTDWLKSNDIVINLDKKITSTVIINDEIFDVEMGDTLNFEPETYFTLIYQDNTSQDFIVTHFDTLKLDKPILEYLELSFPTNDECQNANLQLIPSPNPSNRNGTINVKIKSTITLSDLQLLLTDSNGKATYYSRLNPQKPSANIEISLNNLPAGIYYLSGWQDLESGMIQTTQKIIIQ